MREKLTAFPISGKKPAEIEVHKRTPLNAGGNEKKSVVEGKVASRKVSLIERGLDQKYVENWRAFIAARLPVVPTLRESSNESLLVTDVKVDGAEVYGKGLMLTLQTGAARERSRPEIDKVFLQLTEPVHFKGIEEKAKEYARIADEKLIELPYDDPFELVIHPDGKWELMILDLRYGRAFDAERSNPLHIEAAKKQNAKSVKLFLNQLKMIRAELLKQNKVTWTERLARIFRRS